MASFMFRQTFSGNEAPATLAALIGFVMIDPLVVLQLTNSRETLPTMTALEETILGMSEQVVPQVTCPFEALSTMWAV